MVTRWRLYDPTVPETYVFAINPREMEPIYRGRALSFESTTATDGSNIYWEGNTPPRSWTFAGAVRTQVDHAALVDWTSRRSRIRVTDHFGRQFWVLFERFDATPRRDARRPWLHEYVVAAQIITTPTAPTQLLAS